MSSDWMRPKTPTREEFWDKRGVDYRFRNPPGNEQYARVFGDRERHGEFPSMAKVTGREDANDYKKMDRQRNGEGLVEAEFTVRGSLPK